TRRAPSRSRGTPAWRASGWEVGEPRDEGRSSSTDAVRAFAQRYSLPRFLSARLLEQYGAEEAAALAAALREPAPLALRVNTLKVARPVLRAALLERRILARESPIAED